jgi:hypothetical protein
MNNMWLLILLHCDCSSLLTVITTTENTVFAAPPDECMWLQHSYSVVCYCRLRVFAKKLRTMCGSRTGGWSLSSVMSDWQCYVDWLLAKYCKCRLRLDWCWCRWRTSAKGHRRWGLQVWRRQVGLVRGTRWPAESSAGLMVARTAGQSRGRFLGWASKSRSSRDYVGAESWMAIHGGYTEFAGFAVVYQKTSGLHGWATKPRPKTRRGGAATQASLTTQEGRSDRLAGLTA